jgi:hypothetical protein
MSNFIEKRGVKKLDEKVIGKDMLFKQSPEKFWDLISAKYAA